MCSVPAAELTNRSYTVLPPPLLTKVKSCCERHARRHTTLFGCIAYPLQTDADPVTRPLSQVGFVTMFLSCQFVATRSVTHTMCSVPAVQLTNHSYALLSFYFLHQTCCCPVHSTTAHLPDKFPPQFAANHSHGSLLQVRFVTTFLYVVSIRYHSLSPRSFVSSPYGTYKSDGCCPYLLYCPFRGSSTVKQAS